MHHGRLRRRRFALSIQQVALQQPVFERCLGLPVSLKIQTSVVGNQIHPTPKSLTLLEYDLHLLEKNRIIEIIIRFTPTHIP